MICSLLNISSDHTYIRLLKLNNKQMGTVAAFFLSHIVHHWSLVKILENRSIPIVNLHPILLSVLQTDKSLSILFTYKKNKLPFWCLKVNLSIHQTTIQSCCQLYFIFLVKPCLARYHIPKKAEYLVHPQQINI